MKSRIISLILTVSLIFTLISPSKDNAFAAGAELAANVVVTDKTADVTASLHTVTWDTNGGSAIASQTSDNDFTVTPPATPTKTGYSFYKWSTDPSRDMSVKFPYIVTDNITFYALWQAASTSCTVSFYQNDGNFITTKIINGGISMQSPTTPTKTGCVFLGWYTAKIGGTQVQFPFTPVSDMKLFARWDKCTVTFNSNGGSTVPVQVATEGSSMSAPSQPTKSGYSFLGWYDAPYGANGYGNIVNFPLVVTKDVTVYAEWKKMYSLSFVASAPGVTQMPAKETGVSGTVIKLPESPKAATFTYVGWYSDTGKWQNPITFPYTLTSDITAYACFVKTGAYTTTSATVSFYTGIDASTVPSVTAPISVAAPVTIIGNVQINEPAPPIKTGSYFVGWYDAQTGGNLISFPYKITKDATIYAHWGSAPIQYKVGFDSNGGTGVSGQLVDSGTAISEPNKPVKESNGINTYLFTGWYTAASGGTLINFPFTPTANTTLYARWATYPIIFTGTVITFDSQGGTVVPTQSVDAGTTIAEPTSPISYARTFGGWYTAPIDGRKITFPLTLNDSVTIYAHWIATITFDSKGGSAVDSKTVDINSTNTKIFPPENPQKSGESFFCWDYNDNQIWPANDGTLPIIVTSDITLCALWSDLCTVSFNSNGGSKTDNLYGYFGDTIIAPNDPTYPGYKFNGWFTSATGGTRINFPYLAADNIALYAQWTKLELAANGLFEAEYGIHGGDLCVDKDSSAFNGNAVRCFSGGQYSLTFPNVANANRLTIAYQKSTEVSGGFSFYVNNVKTADIALPYVSGLAGSAFKYQIFSVPVNIPDGADVKLVSSSNSDVTTDYIKLETSGTTNASVHFCDIDRSNGYATIISSRVGIPGTAINPPADPKRIGYTFTGWYTLGDGGTKVNFPYIMNDYTNLYANFVVNMHTITFDSGGGSSVEPINANYNTSIVKPATPTRIATAPNRYYFKGWFTDAIGGTKITFPYRVTADITLHAQWILTEPIQNGKLEAEWILDDISGVTSNNVSTNFECTASGGASVLFNSQEGSSVTFLNVASANNLTICYQIQGYSDGKLSLYINGVKSQDVVFPYPGIWGWFNKSCYKIINIPINIPTGADIKLQYDLGDTVIDLDYINLSTSDKAIYSVNYFMGGGEYTFQGASGNNYSSGTVITEPSQSPDRPGYAFGGWYTAQTGGTRVAFPYTVNANTIIYAQWLPIPNSKYKVDFVSNGTVGAPTQTASYNNVIMAPADPTNPVKSGDVFTGWYTKEIGGTQVTFPYTVKSDVTLFAHWSAALPQKFVVTYTTMGGSYVESATINNGSATTAPINPTRYSFVFSGWYTSDIGGTKVAFPYTVNGDSVFYAQWTVSAMTPNGKIEAENASITGSAYSEYDAFASNSLVVRGFANAGNAITFLNVASANTLSVAFSKPNSNEVKVGLYINSVYTKDIYFPGTNSWSIYKTVNIPVNIPDNSDVMLQMDNGFQSSNSINIDYISLSKSITSTYTINFNTAGGTAVSSKIADSNSLINAPLATSKTGYSFVGWYDMQTGGKQITFPYRVLANTTMYAHWTPNRYTLIFDSNGGSAVASQTVDFGSTVNTPSSPTYTNYLFKGWYTNASGGTKIEFPYTVTGDATFYAQWSTPAVVTYTVTFSSNGGSIVASKIVNNNETVAMPTAPTKTGYTFAGWYDMQTGGNQIAFPYTVTGDATFYAQWSTPVVVTYTVTFSSNGGSAVASKIVNNNDTVAVPTAPTRTGYTFGGWYKEAACTNEWSFSTDKVTSSITLFAKWTINAYTVTFNSMGGNVVTSKSVQYNNLVLTPSKPTRTGFTFLGWYTSTAYTTLWNFTTSKITVNTILYAKWIAATTTGLTVVSAGYNGIKLAWTAVFGANNYEIYRSTSAAGAYTLIATIAATTPSYININLPTNTTYYYKVRGYALVGSTKTYSNYSVVVSGKAVPATPIGVVTTSATYNSIRINWTVVTGANGYSVYRATSLTGTYTLLATVTTNTYTNISLTPGATYYYKVNAYRLVGTTKAYGAQCAAVAKRVVPPTITTFTAIRASATSIKLTWGAISGASGYEIYRSTALAGTYTLLKAQTLLTYTNTTLKTGTTYYYKVRSYRLVGTTKVYSDFSTVKSAKP